VAHQGANNVEDPEQVETLKRFFADESNTHYSHFLTQMEANLANTVAVPLLCLSLTSSNLTVHALDAGMQRGQGSRPSGRGQVLSVSKGSIHWLLRPQRGLAHCERVRGTCTGS
jgi:hypothetical protein